MTNVVPFTPPSPEHVTTDERFGACPECGKSNGYVNVGRDHYGTCDEHLSYWPIGSNLFSGWRDEDPAVWRKNEQLLAARRQVKPIYAKPDPTPWWNRD